jgi:hypothetical protein
VPAPGIVEERSRELLPPGLKHGLEVRPEPVFEQADDARPRQSTARPRSRFGTRSVVAFGASRTPVATPASRHPSSSRCRPTCCAPSPSARSHWLSHGWRRSVCGPESARRGSCGNSGSVEAVAYLVIMRKPGIPRLPTRPAGSGAATRPSGAEAARPAAPSTSPCPWLESTSGSLDKRGFFVAGDLNDGTEPDGCFLGSYRIARVSRQRDGTTR